MAHLCNPDQPKWSSLLFGVQTFRIAKSGGSTKHISCYREQQLCPTQPLTCSAGGPGVTASWKFPCCAEGSPQQALGSVGLDQATMFRAISYGTKVLLGRHWRVGSCGLVGRAISFTGTTFPSLSRQLSQVLWLLCHMMGPLCFNVKVSSAL